MTLSATTLLHEAYLDMAASNGPSFSDRARFLGYAARIMRGLIIDHARSRQAQKRGGRFEITSLATDAGEYVVEACPESNGARSAQVRDALLAQSPACRGEPWYVTIPANVQPN